MGIEKGYKRFRDVLYSIAFMKSFSDMFWMPFTGMSAGRIALTIIMLVLSLEYLIKRASGLRVTVRTYAIGRSSLTRVGVESKADTSHEVDKTEG